MIESYMEYLIECKVNGTWKSCALGAIEKGDIFRMLTPNGKLVESYGQTEWVAGEHANPASVICA